MKAVINFNLERETKGSVRFQEVDSKGKVLKFDDGAKMGTLYIRKTAFDGDKYPEKIKVTIEN